MNSSQNSTLPAGLYVHIPFCLRKCRYCDFYSIADLSFVNAYLDALCREMDLRADARLLFDTLYIGGGTPSILTPEQIDGLIRRAHACFRWADEVETTMEINPGTVDGPKIEGFLSAGVNRISIGVQSFQDKFLDLLGRIHNGRDAQRAIDMAHRAGCKNIGIDLIYGMPGQNEAMLQEDLARAMASGIDHISCYMLSCEPGTPLDQDRACGRFVPADEDYVAALYEITVCFLRENGFNQYEVSNFARRGEDGKSFVSRHNVKYWTFHPYIGLGASAHSYNSAKRWWNHRDIVAYVSDFQEGKIATAGEEILDPAQQMTEAIYLGLRQNRGIDAETFRLRFHFNFAERFRSLIEGLREAGYMEIEDGRYFLTPRGMLQLDGIAARFVSTLDTIRE